MSEEPTVVGSITAQLRIDKSDWNAKRAEAEAEARELGATSPTIRVDANTGDAMSKMAALELLEKRLGLATDNVRLAYQRLDEVQTKGGASQSRLMSLHNAAARAELAEEIATKRLTAARAGLGEAEDEETAATQRSNSAHQSSMQRWQMIAALIAGLIPLMAPLAGYIVGVGGALAGMGAAGVLGVLGVVQAMKQGTLVGQQYSAGLQSLKGDLSTLGGTAAVHLLGAFRDGVYQINAAMPELNREIGGFADQLGGVASTVLQGIITAFRILNPLFVQGGIYVQQLADGFTRWTQDGGLQKFADYAIQALPQVAQTLGALANLAMNLVDSFAPVGTVVLEAITLLSNAISGIPSSLLATVAVGALVAWGAFKMWKAVPGIIDAVKVSMTMMGGALPIAGIVALTNELMVLGGGAIADAVDNMTGLTSKFKEMDSAVASGDLGNSTLQRNADSMRTQLTQMRGDLGGYVGFLMDTSKWMHTNGLDWLGGPEQAVVQGTAGKMASEVDKVTAAQKASTAATGVQVSMQSTLAATYGMSLSAFQAAAEANKTTADQAAATTHQLQLENNASSLLSNALTILNGGSLNVAQAQTGLAAANNTVTDAFKTNGTAITGSSKAAVANQQALQQQAVAAQAAAEAIGQQTGSSKAAVTALTASKTSLEANLKAQGELTPAVQAYIDKLYDLKDLKVPPTKLDVDNANALKVIAATKNALNILNGRTVTVYIEGQQVGDFGHINVGSANKSSLAFAGGGTVGGSGSATSDSVYARLSRTEEVVSNDRGQADRYRPVLKTINAGGDPSKYFQQPTAAAPVIYVQNPFTGEYLLAQVSSVASATVAQSQQASLATGRRGYRGANL